MSICFPPFVTCLPLVFTCFYFVHLNLYFIQNLFYGQVWLKLNQFLKQFHLPLYHDLNSHIFLESLFQSSVCTISALLSLYFNDSSFTVNLMSWLGQRMESIQGVRSIFIHLLFQMDFKIILNNLQMLVFGLLRLNF